MSNSNEIAQIDQINKALTTLNGTLDQTSAKYLTIVKNINDSQATVKLTVQTQENLTKAQKETTESAKQLDAVGKQLAASEQRLKEVEDTRMKTIIENRVATQQATQAIKDKVKAEQAEEGSLIKMRDRLKELTAQYDKTSTRTKEAAKEIDNLSREIGKAEAATNRHQRGVGGYADQLGKLGDKYGSLPGPLGAAATATAGFGKQLWLLVMNPIVATIAGIALVLGGLFKAFTSTDSGAVKFAGALKAVSNVADILMDRLWSTFKLLGSLVTFDWEGMKKNGKDAFGGIGKAIYDTTTAAGRYATMMDDIDDREVAAANRMTKLRVDIETLKNKAAAETGKKKLDMLQQAMDKEIELNGIETGFLTERNDAETMNLASKIQNSKLTMEQKEAQLAQWLAVDDKELASLTEKDAAFAEFIDKNEGEFQKLQKSKADELDKERELQTGTRRLQKGLATERDAENKQAIADAKDRQAKILEGVEIANNKEIVLINKKHIDGITDDKGYQAELIANEVVFLNKKQALYKSDSKEYQDIELQKQAITIKSQDDILKAIEERFKQQKAIEEQGTKDLEDLLKQQTTAEEKAADEAIKTGEKLVEDKKKLDEDYAKSKKEKDKDVKDAAIDLARDTINAVFEMQNMKLEKEMSDLEKKKDKELSNKNLTESQKAKIEADFDKKAGAIKTKQAQQAKLQGLFDIAIGTAVSVMNAKGNIPLMIILAAMGAVQAALVAARPIPKYAKGTKSAEREGIFGEAGLEVMFPKGGGAIFADKPTYFEGDRFKGAQIKNSDETKRLVGMVADRNIIVKNQTDDRLLNEMKEVKQAIINKKEWIMDSDHRIIGQKTSNHQEIYLNRLINRN